MSAEGKHTATPWRMHHFFPLWIVPDGQEMRSRGGAQDDAEDSARFAQDICSLQDCTRHRSTEEVLANARLIVSAVNQREELLEALRHEMQRNHEHHAAACDGCKQAEAALRKAGEVPCHK